MTSAKPSKNAILTGADMLRKMRIFSWNVNGLRAVLNKGALQKFLDEEKPDILCLQEIKARPEQVLHDFPGYVEFWNPAKRPGYSGTAILVSEADLLAKNVIRWASGETASNEANPSAPSGIYIFGLANLNLYASETSIAVSEGRTLILEFPEFYLVNVYTPNSKHDLSRLKLRETEWDPGFLEMLKELEKTKPVVACGDFNAAHTEIDLARPKDNEHNAGYTPEERQGIENLLRVGFIDTFRELHPDEKRYTWWTWRANARARNIGWRIDYFFISEALRKNLKSAEIYEKVAGSDHCPVGIDLEF